MFLYSRVFETKINELQDELLLQKGSCAKLEAQLEFSKERYDIMKGNIDSYKKVNMHCLLQYVSVLVFDLKWCP